MLRPRSLVLAASALGALLTVAPAARAADPEELFQEGRRLLKEGNYDAACAVLEESLKLRYGLATEFNLAECEEKRRRRAQAYAHYAHVAAVASERGESERAQVAGERARAVEAQLARVNLRVAEVPDEEVLLDGERLTVAAGNADAVVEPGPHDVEARAPGRQRFVYRFRAVRGQPVAVTVPALKPVVTTVQPSPSPPPSPRTPPQTPATPPEAPPSHTLSRVGVGFATAGLLFGAGSLVLYVDAQRRVKDFPSQCTDGVCPDALASTYRSAKLENQFAIATGVTGAVFLVGGIGLALAGAPASPSKTAAVKVAPVVGPSTLGVGATGAF